MKATGADVTYRACDVGSASDVARVVAEVGDIHACMHGAGAEDSQLLAAKYRCADTVGP